MTTFTPDDPSRVPPEKRTALLVGVQLPGVSDIEHEGSMAELSRLVTTMGLTVVGSISQRRASFAAGSIVGAGKLLEIARYTGGTGIIQGFRKHKPKFNPDGTLARDTEESGENDDDSDDDADARRAFGAAQDEDRPRAGHEGSTSSVIPSAEGASGTSDDEDPPHAAVVVFDCEIGPTQLKNLEQAAGCEILDRTGVILEIFSRHARSREARLQVEIAKLGYLAPRLRASSVGGDRQGGGIGAKGAGETAHELDRRRIRDRIAELRRQLAAIHAEQGTRRASRKDANCVALVGYTNAGKSSLMRALTGSEVLVADKLFATLDTTVRALHPESMPRVLVSDTVGFIKKLPHDLVASFRSTLDEAMNASLLLFVVDASDPTFRSQLEVTRTVLGEIGVDTTSSRLLLNKCDRLDARELGALRAEFPDAIQLSAKRPADITRLREILVGFFETDMIDADLFVPYARGAMIGKIRAELRVLSERHEDEGTTLSVRGDAAIVDRLKKMI